jgi:hypothetical protein
MTGKICYKYIWKVKKMKETEKYGIK